MISPSRYTLAYIFLIIHKRKLFHRISSKFEQIHWYYWGYDDLMFSLLRSLNYLKVLELAEERRNLLQLGIANLFSVKFPSILVAFNVVPMGVVWLSYSFCVCYIWSKFHLQLIFVKKQDDSLDLVLFFVNR